MSQKNERTFPNCSVRTASCLHARRSLPCICPSSPLPQQRGGPHSTTSGSLSNSNANAQVLSPPAPQAWSPIHQCSSAVTIMTRSAAPVGVLTTTASRSSLVDAEKQHFAQTGPVMHKFGIQELFHALEKHKMEQHEALQTMRHDLESRMNKIEDTVHCSLKAVQAQCQDEHQELNDALSTARNALVQVARELSDVLTRMPSSDKAHGSVERKLLQKVSPPLHDGLTEYLHERTVRHIEKLRSPKAEIKNTFPPIAEEPESACDHITQARPNGNCVLKHGTKVVSASGTTDGKHLEKEMIASPEPGKACLDVESSPGTPQREGAKDNMRCCARD